MKANPERCAHPTVKHTTPSFGRTTCSRCDADLTPPQRRFTVRHSERVTLTQGDRVAVRSGPHGAAFQGVFHWVEKFPSGLAYCIAERQTFKHEGKTFEETAAFRFIRPEYVRQAPGVRDRKAREEVA